MDGLFLQLIPEGRDTLELQLQSHSLEASILDVAKTYTSYVFCDLLYKAKICNPPVQIQNLQFLINGSSIDISYIPENGEIMFHDRQFGAQIFSECYGFVQIALHYDDGQGNWVLLETEYVQVMVRKGFQNDSVRRMTEYIFRENVAMLLGSETLPRDIAGLKEGSRKTLEAHILLLKQISGVLEENYRFFKTNCRFVCVPQERVDHFEKLQFVSQNTIQYIIQHPDELLKVYHSSGIRIGNTYYQPNKTMITDNVRSFDIYENRVVLGFIATLINEICAIEAELDNILSAVPGRPLETDDYIMSTYFIYVSTITSIKTIVSDVKILHHKYATLYASYADALGVKPECVRTVPKYSPIFRSIPQYHQVYNCAVSWFNMGVFSLNQVTYMLSFFKTSDLYEVYVLAKLINYFLEDGYTVEKTLKVYYPFSGNTTYKNTGCNNEFVLKRGKSMVTVYYQPVLYNADRRDICGIGLYRNTSISFPEPDLGSTTGRYYTPDYLIKYEYEGRPGSKYVIADAKFSSLKTVRQHQVAKLAYKYLFSVSPIDANDQIIALYVFNGQSSEPYDIISDIYDYKNGDEIYPVAKIVTLTENSTANTARHAELLKNSAGLYCGYSPATVAHIPKMPFFPEELQPEPMSIVPADSIRTSNSERINTETPDMQRENTGQNKPAHSAKGRKTPQLDTTTISIHDLKLYPPDERMLFDAGYSFISDLIPNKAKGDLANNRTLNRRLRREIEAKLKEFRIKLN